MNPLVHHFATCAYNNGWANYRLLRACAELSDAAFVATRVGFFPSIKATLNHNLTVDWFYVDAIERGLQGLPAAADARRFFEPEEPFDTVAPLEQAQRAVDRRLVDACTGLRDDDLQRPIAVSWRDGVKREPLTRLLGHLLQHQIHHRGQVHAMLAGTDVAPPQLDEFFCANEAPGRAAELAALGWSEALIWG